LPKVDVFTLAVVSAYSFWFVPSLEALLWYVSIPIRSVTPSVADAVAVLSARLVAVRVTTPAEEGAVNVTAFPDVLVVGEKEPPPLDDHVTPALVVSFPSVAVIESACEVTRPPRLGDTLTAMLEPPEAVIVTPPEADFVVSAWAIAVTVTVAGFGTAEGAV
jgi:hypothetical protein